MNIKYILYIVLFILILHIILYFLNIDLFDYYENYVLRKNKNNSDINIESNINELQQSLEELKDNIDN